MGIFFVMVCNWFWFCGQLFYILPNKIVWHACCPVWLHVTVCCWWHDIFGYFILSQFEFLWGISDAQEIAKLLFQSITRISDMMFISTRLSHVHKGLVLVASASSVCSADPVLCADSSEPLLLAYISYGYRWRLRPNLRALVPLNMSPWACNMCIWTYS